MALYEACIASLPRNAKLHANLGSILHKTPNGIPRAIDLLERAIGVSEEAPCIKSS